MANLKANVPYNDMRGTLALDWAVTGLFELAKEKGVDTDKYFPIAFSFYGFPPRYFTIYAIDCGITGAKNFEGNAKFVEENGGNAPVVQFDFTGKLEDLSKHIKDFKAVLHSKNTDSWNMDIKQQVGLE